MVPIWKLDFAMKSFPIMTDELCELCEGETAQQATQLVVLDSFRWFGSRLILCDGCKQRLLVKSFESGGVLNENCDQ